MKKNLRKEILLRRKNFLPSLIISCLLFISLASLIYFTDPKFTIFVYIFFINLFTLLFFVFSLIFAHTRRGLITAMCVTTFTIFKFFGIENILNAILIISLGIISEIYAETSKRAR